MTVNVIRNGKFVDVLSALSIASLGLFINAMYFTFEYLEFKGSVWAEVWAAPIERALVMATVPLYIAIGYLYWLEKKARRKLEEATKMKDLFTDILSHDLLNPVNAIQNCAELLEDSSGDKELIDMIMRQSDRLTELVDNASKLSFVGAQEKLELMDSDLGEYARTAIDEMAPLAEKRRIKLVGEFDGKYPVKCNPIFGEVFVNFLSNAIKYGPTDSNVALTITDHGDAWRISVKDNGPGIPDEYKEEIFRRFERKDKGGVKGSGLGLAIVRGIVALHNGKVWVEDNKPRGCIFYVDFPKKE